MIDHGLIVNGSFTGRISEIVSLVDRAASGKHSHPKTRLGISQGLKISSRETRRVATSYFTATARDIARFALPSRDRCVNGDLESRENKCR